MFERKKVGLALGEGGARGLAHIGVLKVLEEYNIPIDFISGTSMGAVIAALYSAEPNAKKLEKDALEIEWNKIFDYTIPRSGVIKGDKIEKLLYEKLHNLEFKDMKIPLFITAFDLENRQEIIFNKGNVVKALRASISIPGFFIPVENNNKILVDGGVVDPIPTEPLKKAGAEIIIAINVDCIKEKKPLRTEEATLKKTSKKMPSIIENASQSLQVMTSEACKADLRLHRANFIITVDAEDIGTLEFGKVEEAIKLGEAAARKSLDKIKSITQPTAFRLFLNSLKENLGMSTIVEDIKEDIQETKEEKAEEAKKG